MNLILKTEKKNFYHKRNWREATSIWHEKQKSSISSDKQQCTHRWPFEMWPWNNMLDNDGTHLKTMREWRSEKNTKKKKNEIRAFNSRNKSRFHYLHQLCGTLWWRSQAQSGRGNRVIYVWNREKRINIENERRKKKQHRKEKKRPSYSRPNLHEK